MLSVPNEMGAVLVQTKPIGSSSILLAAMVALVQAHGTATYSAEALQEVDHIQQLLAGDVRMQYFTLRQPEEEVESAKTKALVTDVLSTLNLHTVFPVLTSANRKLHQTALENLNY